MFTFITKLYFFQKRRKRSPSIQTVSMFQTFATGPEAKTGTEYQWQNHYLRSFPHPVNQVLRVELEADGIGRDEQHQSQTSVSHCDLSGCGGPARSSERPPPPSRVSAQCAFPGRRRGQISPTHPWSMAAISSHHQQPRLKGLNPFTLERC